jgi:hypothetical protein
VTAWAHRTPTPARLVWAERERAAAWATMLAGGSAIAFGARQVAASGSGAEEIAYLVSCGLGGLLAVLVGIGLLLIADVRDQGIKLARIERVLAGEPLPDPRATILELRDGESSDAMGRHGVRRVVLFGRWVAVPSFLVAAGAIVVSVGWYRAATTGRLSVALQGLVAAGIGSLLAVLGIAVAGLRASANIRRQKARLLRSLVVTADDDRPAGAEAEDDGGLWTAEGLHRTHRAGCAALAMAAAPPRRTRRDDRGLVPCLLCQDPEVRRA